MAEDFTYTLIITDQGTPTIKRVAAAAKVMGQEITGSMTMTQEAAARADALLKSMHVNYQNLGAMGKSMHTQLARSLEASINKTALNQLKQAGLITEEVSEKAEKGFRGMSREAKRAAEEASATHRAVERLYRTALAFVGMWVLTKVLQIPREVISGAIEFNSQLETSKLGISSILMGQGKFTDTIGRSIEGYSALVSAQEMSGKLVKQLQVDNLKTIATFDQLVKAFQQTLAPGLQKGFDVEQVREFTVAMVQAAGALGLNLDMLAEETRSLLRGTINPRQTLIATALGITNEDVRRFQGNSQALFDFLMSKLNAFRVAGIESQKTWTGLASNIKDAVKMLLGIGLEDLFKFAKREAQALFDWIVVIDKVTGEMKLNPELLESLKRVGYLIEGAYLTVKDIAIIMGELRGPVDLLAEAWRSISISAESWRRALGGGVGEKTPEKGYAKTPWGSFKEPEWFGKYRGKGMVESATMALKDFNDMMERAIKGPGKLKDSWELLMGMGTTYNITPQDMKEDEVNYLLKLASQTGSINEMLKKRLDINIGSINVAKTLGSLHGLELQTAIKMYEEYSKLKDTSKETEDAFKKMLFVNLEIARIDMSQAVTKIEMDVAKATDQYERQKQIIEETNIQNQRKLYLADMLTSKLKTQMDVQTKQATDEVDRLAELGRLEKQRSIAGLQESYAKIRGDLDGQLSVMRESLAVEIRELEIAKERTKDGEKQTLIEKQIRNLIKLRSEEQVQALAVGRTKREEPLLTTRLSLAENLGNVEEYRKVSRQILDNELYLLETQERENPLLEKIIDAKIRQWKVSADLKQVEMETYAPDRLAQVQAKLADMTGDLQLQEKASKSLLDNDILRVKADAKLSDYQKDLIPILKEIDEMTNRTIRAQMKVYGSNMIQEVVSQYSEMVGSIKDQNEAQQVLLENKIKVLETDSALGIIQATIIANYWRQTKAIQDQLALLNQQKDALDLKSEFTTLLGDYDKVKKLEVDILEVQKQQALLKFQGAENQGTRDTINNLYNLKKARAEAEGNLNVPKLVGIGVSDAAIKSNQDLADTYKNVLPDAVGVFTDSIKNSEGNIKTFLKNIGEGFLNLAQNIMLTILKTQILNALQSAGIGGATKAATEAAGQAALTGILSTQIPVVGALAAEYWNLAAAKAAAGIGGGGILGGLFGGGGGGGGAPYAAMDWGGAADYGAFGMQHGGTFMATRPTMLKVGEAGAEEVSVIPLGRDKDSTGGNSYVIMNIEATDVDSFERKYRSSVNKIIHKSERQTGSVRRLTR